MKSVSERPNILFILTDQQRSDWLAPNPDIPVRTPNLERLGDRGVRFTRALCPSPLCAPTRACLASGKEYERCGVLDNDVPCPPGQQTYHRRLRDEAGYHVMGCGKFHVGNNTPEPNVFSWGLEGRALMREWGYSDALFNAGKNQAAIMAARTGRPCDPYLAYLRREGLMQAHISDYERRSWEWEERPEMWSSTFPTSLPEEAYCDNWITRNGSMLLDRAPAGKPWYLEVNLQNPHHPWDITEGMHRLYREPEAAFPLPEFCDLDLADGTHAEVRRNYAAMVEHLDQCLGRFLAKLKERGELENTLVVFASDHGEMLGDYGQWQKKSPLQASVGVPLVIAGPGVDRRGPCHAPATIVDLHATFVECAGLVPAHGIDSRSMAPFLSGAAADHREVVFSALGPWRLAFDGRYKLIEGYDPQKRRGGYGWEPHSLNQAERRRMQRQRPPILYDLEANERDNAAPDHPEIVERLARMLEENRP